jgi:hypothetical protein
MARVAKSDQQTEALLANVLKSVKTAREILTHFRTSLVQSGFEKGIPSYQKMCATLLGQKLWSQTFRNEELDKEFRNLAGSAVEIYEVLAPYTEIMKKLSAISALEQPETTIPASEEVILKTLRERGIPISLSALKNKVKMKEKDLRLVLEVLEKKGRVGLKKSSGRQLYFLVGQ